MHPGMLLQTLWEPLFYMHSPFGDSNMAKYLFPPYILLLSPNVLVNKGYSNASVSACSLWMCNNTNIFLTSAWSLDNSPLALPFLEVLKLLHNAWVVLQAPEWCGRCGPEPTSGWLTQVLTGLPRCCCPNQPENIFLVWPVYVYICIYTYFL